jgi:hypothetical protein
MRYTVIVLGLAAAACGGSSGSSSSAANTQTLNTLSQNISSAAAAYGTQASGMMDTTACNTDETGYEAQVRPMVEQMQGMGPEMDQMMGSLGHGTDADMTCAANAMVAEINRHKSVACSSTTDMGPNKSEAQQHVATMTEWANHQMVRSHDMGSMMGMGMGGMGGGGGMTTGHCVENGDGSFSME